MVDDADLLRNAADRGAPRRQLARGPQELGRPRSTAGRYEALFSVVDTHAVTVEYDPKEMPGRVFETALTYIAVRPRSRARAPSSCRATSRAHRARLVPRQRHADGRPQPHDAVQGEERGAQAERQRRALHVPDPDGRRHPALQGDGRSRSATIRCSTSSSRARSRVASTPASATSFRSRSRVSRTTPRIMGLDGKTKMSKTRGNTIDLFDPPTVIEKKLKGAFTDPDKLRHGDPGRPEICNVFTMHTALTGAPSASRHRARLPLRGARLRRVQAPAQRRHGARARARFRRAAPSCARIRSASSRCSTRARSERARALAEARCARCAGRWVSAPRLPMTCARRARSLRPAALPALLACEADPVDAGPEAVVEELVSRLQRVHGDPKAARAAYELLWGEAKRGLAERAKRASAVAGRDVAPESMIAPTRFSLRFTPRRYTARIDGDWAVVSITGEVAVAVSRGEVRARRRPLARRRSSFRRCHRFSAARAKAVKARASPERPWRFARGAKTHKTRAARFPKETRRVRFVEAEFSSRRRSLRSRS